MPLSSNRHADGMSKMHVCALRLVAHGVLGLALAIASSVGWTQGHPPAQPAGPAVAKAPELGISDWLKRLQGASRQRSYIGTFVVSAGTSMSSARIWHVCDGDLQVERVESLSGEPRLTFRRNDQVITFSPHSQTAVAEKRESLGLFPQLLRATDASIGQFYGIQEIGVERVAGYDADVVQLQPRDGLRFGYRIWSEVSSGMLLKVQTLDGDGKVLEQAAFSEVQLDAPVSVSKLTKMMENTSGYRVDRPEPIKTTALAEGWALKSPVPGFRSMSCHKRPGAGGVVQPVGGGAMQWVFSDGLASVSLFVEGYDARRHKVEGVMAMGATHALTRRLSDKSGSWWLTAIGEVPRATLASFAQELERTR